MDISEEKIIGARRLFFFDVIVLISNRDVQICEINVEY